MKDSFIPLRQDITATAMTNRICMVAGGNAVSAGLGDEEGAARVTATTGVGAKSGGGEGDGEGETHTGKEIGRTAPGPPVRGGWILPPVALASTSSRHGHGQAETLGGGGSTRVEEDEEVAREERWEVGAKSGRQRGSRAAQAQRALHNL